MKWRRRGERLAEVGDRKREKIYHRGRRDRTQRRERITQRHGDAQRFAEKRGRTLGDGAGARGLLLMLRGTEGQAPAAWDLPTRRAPASRPLRRAVI